tara:strand:+ start:124 stop:423 length:300 start_codon:yes stop_codon:yes gene_type:complete
MEEKMKRLEEVMVAAKDAATAANKQMELIANEKSALEAALNQQEKKLEKLSLEVCVHRAHICTMCTHTHTHTVQAGCARVLYVWHARPVAHDARAGRGP